AGTFIHNGLGHSAADWKAAAQARSQISRREGEELLVAVTPVAVLLGKHPANGYGLHGTEKETRQGQRDDFIDVVPANVRQAEARKTTGNFTQEFNSMA